MISNTTIRSKFLLNTLSSKGCIQSSKRARRKKHIVGKNRETTIRATDFKIKPIKYNQKVKNEKNKNKWKIISKRL